MKRRLIISTVATLFFAAGSAWAGGAGGCAYGQKNADLVNAESSLDLIADEETDPKLLALIQQRKLEREQWMLEQPIIQN